MERPGGTSYRWIGFSSFDKPGAIDELKRDLGRMGQVGVVLCDPGDLDALRAHLPGLPLVACEKRGPLPSTVWVAAPAAQA